MAARGPPPGVGGAPGDDADAFLPDDGQSALDLLPAHISQHFTQSAHEHGDGWLIPKRPLEALGVRDADTRAWLEPLLVPHPLATYADKLRFASRVRQLPSSFVGKGCQVTLTSVGRTGEEHFRLAANGAVVGYQRRIQGHVFGMCNPLYDIPRLLGLYRAGQLKLGELITRRYSLDEISQGYQDLDDGKLIRGVIIHEA